MTQTQQQPGKPIEPTPAAGQPAGAPRKAGPARVAAVAVRAGQAFVLSLRLGRAGEPPVVVESSQVLAASVLADRQALAKLVPAGVDVVGVIPASAAAVRTVRAELPVDAPADALVGPLSLMAEAQYPSSPAHRRGAGRLVMSGDQAVPAYAVTTWTGSAGDVERLGNMAKAWVPEQVALSWLHRLSGSRGAGMSVIADRDSGWIVMAGIGREGVSLRTVRDDPEDHEAFAQTLSDAMEEAAEAIDAQVPASLASLNGVARSIRLSGGTSALAGIARDERPEWLANFGTCLGAGAAYLLSDPAEAGLVSMRLAPPRVGGQIVQRVLTVLGSPVVVIAAAGLLASAVLFGPLAAAAMRKSTLEQRAASMAGSQGQAQSVKDEADLFALQRERRWPMTRLIGELVGTIPAGITIETMSFERGKPVTITGSATDGDVVSEWRSTINGGRVFRDAQIPELATGSVPVRFTLRADVAQPLLALSGDAATLRRGTEAAARNASFTDAPAGGGAARSGSVSGGGGAGSSGGQGGSSRAANSGGSRAAAADDRPIVAVPPPLTDAQIDALDRAGIVREFGSRRSAAQQPSLDEATKGRLNAEAEKLRNRLTAPAGKAGAK
ncbi:MAG: PilN domain-containing protein [Planctomyces sp.]|jgi:Tfp pilus assembly protein PilN